MTAIQEMMYNQITQARLRKENRQTRKFNKKQAALNVKTVARRRAAEDRQLARELGCEVSDFA